MADTKEIADYYRSRHNLPIEANDQDVLAFARENDPDGLNQIQQYVLNGEHPQHPIIDAFNKGFMEQPISNDASLGENAAHFIGEYGLPSLGAMGGSIAGSAGTVAGTMAGAAIQKAGQSLLQAISPQRYGEGANTDPINTANDVIKKGAIQGLLEVATLGGKAILNKAGEKLPAMLSASTKIPQGDVETALARPADVFSEKTPGEIQQIYKEGITSHSQDMLPGFSSLDQQAQPLKHFMEDYADKLGPGLGMLKKADEASVAQNAADLAMKAIRNGGKVVTDTGESRLLTPQEAFNGLQGMNYFRFNKEAAGGKFADKINQEAYDGLIDHLEKNGYPAIRDSFLTWREGSVAKKFTSWLPQTAKGKPDLLRAGEMGWLAARMATQSGHPVASGLEALGLAAQSPRLVGLGIKYGVPTANVLGPLMNKAATPTNILFSQLIDKSLRDNQDESR